MATSAINQTGLLRWTAAVLFIALGCSSAAPDGSPQATSTESAQPPLSSAPASALPSVTVTTGAEATPSAPLDNVSPTPEPAGPTPTATPAAGPSPTPAATPTPTASAKGEGLEVDWRQNPGDPGLGYVYEMRASAAANGRFVLLAWGENPDDPVFTSGNGRNWELVTMPEGQAASLRDVVAAGPGFVAVGSDRESGQAVSYVSADGRTWQRFLVDLPEGFFFRLGGHVGNRAVFEAETGLAVSDDGQTWQFAAKPEGFGTIGDFASEGTMILAFASENEGNESRRRVLVWRSTDGLTWERIGALPGSEGVDSIVAARGPLGWSVIGSAYRRSGATDSMAWYSADGGTWHSARGGPSNITDMFADEDGYIAVGHYYPGAGCAIDETDTWGTTWTSIDGSVWRQMPERGWHHREIDLLRRYGRTLIGIGIDWTRGASNGSIWTAELSPASAEGPPPAATPTPEPNEGCG